MTVWFTADLHLGHRNIIQYCNRPFAHVDAMNEGLVAGWNKRVQDGDSVYLLGDLALCKPDLAIAFVSRLKGHKFFIYGNHDKPLRGAYERSGLFEWCRDLREIEVEGQKIVLCHYAMQTWNRAHHGAWMLHGHSHGSLAPKPGKILDVGVDCFNYAPVSFAEVKTIMDRKPFRAEDHHGA